MPAVLMVQEMEKKKSRNGHHLLLPKLVMIFFNSVVQTFLSKKALNKLYILLISYSSKFSTVHFPVVVTELLNITILNVTSWLYGTLFQLKELSELNLPVSVKSI